MDEMTLQGALEAILFASGDSLDEERLCAVLGVDIAALEAAADTLAREYTERQSGIRLIRLDGKLQLVSAPDHGDLIIRALEKRRPNKLSPTSLEVLAIIAYYQPVTRSYIEKVRGVDSSYTVAYLLERGLIEPCGHLDAPGRPTLLATTEQFLRVMGLSSLQELPPLPDIATDEGMAALQTAIETAESGGAQIEMESL